MRVIGAGLSRTGTVSLSRALSRLLRIRVYHGGTHARDIFQWGAVFRGELELRALLNGYEASLDWPPAAFWSELAAEHPSAVVLLSSRDSDSWWRSADMVIFRHVRRLEPLVDRSSAAADIVAFFRQRFAWPLTRSVAIAAYERHNARVRASVSPDRLIDWRLGAGWKPICDRLGVAIPMTPFPHENRSPW